MAYVAQSAAASFNPAHRLMEQTISAANRAKLNSEALLKKDAINAACILGNGIKLAYLVSGGLYRNLRDYSLTVSNNDISSINFSFYD